MLIPDLIIQLITVVIGVVLYTAIFKIVKNIAHKYGFILRYPKGKEDITGYKYEPWHLRYVGKEIAKEIYESDITLEEYKVKILVK